MLGYCLTHQKLEEVMQGSPRRPACSQERRRTTWLVDGQPVEVEIPVSGSTEEARERFERNTAAQAERYGFAPPSRTLLQERRDEDAEREYLR